MPVFALVMTLYTLTLTFLTESLVLKAL